MRAPKSKNKTTAKKKARAPQRPKTNDQRLPLRPYRPTDFDAMLALDQQCFVEGIAYPAAELAHYVRKKNGFTIVAEDPSGELAGFLIAHMQRDYGWIITID